MWEKIKLIAFIIFCAAVLITILLAVNILKSILIFSIMIAAVGGMIWVYYKFVRTKKVKQ